VLQEGYHSQAEADTVWLQSHLKVAGNIFHRVASPNQAPGRSDQVPDGLTNDGDS